MPIAVIALLVIVVGAGVVIRTTNHNSNTQSDIQVSVKALSENSPQSTVVPNTPAPTNTIQPTETQVPTKTPTQIISPTSKATDSSGWEYPGAIKVGNNTYQTSDSPEKVTDWYKNKIRAMNFNLNTFITTNANDQVKNRLTGSGNGSKIDIQINKLSSSSSCEIVLNNN